MNTVIPKRTLILIVVGTIAALLFKMWPAALPPPPDFTEKRIVSIDVNLNGRFRDLDPAEFRKESNGMLESATAASQDPKLMASLIELIRSSRPVTRCRCSGSGWIRLIRDDGTSIKIAVIPSHNDMIDIHYERGRYVIDRDTFLAVVEPLGLPPKRWYELPPYRDPIFTNDDATETSFWLPLRQLSKTAREE